MDRPPTAPGQRWRIVRFAALIALAVTQTAFSCYVSPETDSETADYSEPPAVEFLADVVPPASGDGETAQETLAFRGRVTARPRPRDLEIVWYPPPGASGFEFSPSSAAPEAGGPPFVWPAAPVGADGASPVIQARFQAPAAPEIQVHTVTVSDGDRRGAASAAINARGLDAATLGPAAPADAAAGHAATGGGPGVGPAAAYDVWRINYYIGASQLTTMTAQRCQEWVDLLQRGDAFLALRFPVHQAAGSGYALPLVFHGDHMPVLNFMDTSVSPAEARVALPLEYLPDYFSLLESQLPSEAPADRWLALGASSTPKVTCPGGMDVTRWEAVVDAYLDFGGRRGVGANETLWVAYAFRGPEAPFFFPQAMAPRPAMYQGNGLTVLGPHPMRLLSPMDLEPPVVLGGAHLERVGPGQGITVSHYVSNDSRDTVRATLTVTSTGQLQFGAYAGTNEGPTVPLEPIDNPISLPASGEGQTKFVWLIADVPADAKAGPETVRLTVQDEAAPYATAWTSDIVWVGDWVAPPMAATATSTPEPEPTISPTATASVPSPTPSPPVRLWLPWTHKDPLGGGPGP